ncbi:LUD domain-containing protein [Sorangium sp. So ce327]|uniref:LUD domain-containing protein n=1 Tax=Sorangium sp. So ce327 TaxID=3133301 RepID=UPI003F638A93
MLGAFELDSTLARARIDADDLGITRAAGAIAETAPSSSTTRPPRRAAARSPPGIHVAIVRRADIHRSLCAEISALGGDPYVVRCTGPSKTADVEGILIQGVHGPGEPIAQIVDAW